MDALKYYARPEELKALAACEFWLANGGSLMSGRKVELPLRADPGVKGRVTAAILKTSATLPSARNAEQARVIIAHLVFVLGNSLVVHGPETAYNMAEVLQEEAGLKFDGGSVSAAMDRFEVALATQQETELLECMKTIWK